MNIYMYININRGIHLCHKTFQIDFYLGKIICMQIRIYWWS